MGLTLETAMLNLVPSETILYVAIATKGGSKSKNDLHLNESFWKELSDESKDNLFSCSPCRDIQGWNWRNRDQKFWKKVTWAVTKD